MSVAEILAELPNLSREEFDCLFKRMVELQQLPVFVASPELLKAIAEADAEPEENCVDIEEARRIMESWSSESFSRPKQ